MDKRVDISGLDKADVLLAAFNNSKQQGMGFLHKDGAVPMTREEATEIVCASAADPCGADDHSPTHRKIAKAGAGVQNRMLRFDYLRGRVLKINISDDEVDPRGYDRDNGEGAFAAAIDTIRRRAS